ncbi:MFS transporter [Pedobacter hartonius]|uniref:Predicted arabinose efflux permease, MFS family n=1 Tax=Pedobacter hartonius TaxID=425514 RepID=A0A1H3WPG2_9SPHI|nr:MFS transporter [Pedobacter hartonius]SDZ89019.1 Predicted arabinose efflux permease, MFS family [Pedobacter hartonius]
MNTINKKHSGIATLLAFGLIPLSGFTTDIYLPSLPNMAADLHVSSIQVQLTFSIYLISYGISQLFIGSILDSFGRYKIGLICLLILTVSSALIALIHNIYVIYLMRVIQGLAVGAVVVAKRAYFVDLFSGEKLKSYLSLFSIIWSTGPIVAPFVGGYLQSVFGWQSNFYFLACFAFSFAVLEFFFSGETLVQGTPFNIRKIAGIYLGMIKTPIFTLSIVMLGLAYCMILIYNLTGAFIIEHHLNFSPVVAGYSSLISGIAWMIGGFIGKATINLHFFKKIAVNLTLQFFFVLAMIISTHYLANLYTLIFFAFIIHICAGFTFNNYFAFCLGLFPRNAGIAGGLTGGVSYMIISLLSYEIVNYIPAKDELNLGYGYGVLVLISFVVLLAISKIKKKRYIRFIVNCL